MRFALPLLALVLLAPSASAIAYDLEAREDAQGQSYFALAGDDARNPTLSAAPGDTLTIHFANRGQLTHNVRLAAPLSAETPCCQAPGEERTLVVQVPANLSGEVRYQDVLHTAAFGVLRVGPPLPNVRIVDPINGANVPRRVELRVQVSNFTLGVDGRIRYSWDAGNATLTTNSTNTSHVFEGLGNGPHLLGAELVGMDGASLEPSARDDVVVYVLASATDGPTSAATPSATPSSTPPAGKTPGVELPLALLAVALVALRVRR